MTVDRARERSHRDASVVDDDLRGVERQTAFDGERHGAGG